MEVSSGDLKNISQVWKTGRLLIGKTQFELSRELNISQSSISKYETLKLEPSASDWYKFCLYAGFDAHKTLELGYIDGRTKFKHGLFASSLFSLPIRYRSDFMIKVREFIPFKEFVCKELGEEAFDQFLSEIKVSKEIFNVYDFQVSLNLINDLIDRFKEQKISVLEEVRKYSSDFSSHGILASDYLKRSRPTELLKSLVESQLYYHRVFKSKLFLEGERQNVSFELMSEAITAFDEKILRRFMEYKLLTFKDILSKNTGQDFDFNVVEDHSGLTFSFAV